MCARARGMSHLRCKYNWMGQINKTYTTNPFMSCASLIADAKVKEPTKKESIPEHDDPSGGTPAGGGDDEEEGVGYDSDDSTKGVTSEWCSDNQFSNGGVRSAQDALEFGNNENKANAGGPNTELEEEVVVQKSQGGKRFATIYDPLVQVEAPASKPQKRSRSGQVAPDVERHRKMILMASLEILGLISSTARTEKATICRKESCALVGTRVGGQPPGISKLQAKLAPTKSTKSFAAILK